MKALIKTTNGRSFMADVAGIRYTNGKVYYKRMERDGHYAYNDFEVNVDNVELAELFDDNAESVRDVEIHFGNMVLANTIYKKPEEEK